MASIREKYGKPKTGGSGPKMWTLKGEKAAAPEVYRILPPTKSLADSGKWFFYHAQHWGFSVPDKTDKSKSYTRTFGCPQKESYGGLVEVECEECTVIEEKKAQLEEKKKELEKKGLSEEVIKSMLSPLSDWLSAHNRDGKYYIGVKNRAGEFGILGIPGKMKKALETCIASLKKSDEIDALDIDKGAWIHFQRTGLKASDMNFVATPFKEKVQVTLEGGKTRMVEEIVVDALSDSDLEAAQRDIPDLATFIYYPTPEQVKELARGSGDPEEVERILFSRVSKERSAEAPKATPKPTRTVEAPKPAPEPVAAPEPAEDDEEAALAAALAALKAKKAAKAAAVETKVETKKVELAPPKTGKPGMSGPVPTDTMTDEELIQAYGEG